MCAEIIEKILSKMENLSLNQNLITLIVCYIGVAFASMHGFDCLCQISWLLFIASAISVLISLIFYTIEYCKKKWYRGKTYQR